MVPVLYPDVTESEGTEAVFHGHRLIMCGSNNYLGLTKHPKVREAAIEAIRAGIKFLVVIPEHIPIHDMLYIREEAVRHQATVIGGNTAGIITPGEANLGIMPEIAFSAGRVGTVSRSGSITYYVADTLTRTGYGRLSRI